MSAAFLIRRSLAAGGAAALAAPSLFFAGVVSSTSSTSFLLSARSSSSPFASRLPLALRGVSTRSSTLQAAAGNPHQVQHDYQEEQEAHNQGKTGSGEESPHIKEAGIEVDDAEAEKWSVVARMQLRDVLERINVSRPSPYTPLLLALFAPECFPRPAAQSALLVAPRAAGAERSTAVVACTGCEAAKTNFLLSSFFMSQQHAFSRLQCAACLHESLVADTTFTAPRASSSSPGHPAPPSLSSPVPPRAAAALREPPARSWGQGRRDQRSGRPRRPAVLDVLALRARRGGGASPAATVYYRRACAPPPQVHSRCAAKLRLLLEHAGCR